jgi:hypothetical protein
MARLTVAVGLTVFFSGLGCGGRIAPFLDDAGLPSSDGAANEDSGSADQDASLVIESGVDATPPESDAGVVCGPENCAGCCQADDHPTRTYCLLFSDQDWSACGTGGRECLNCSGVPCVSGVCVN